MQLEKLLKIKNFITTRQELNFLDTLKIEELEKFLKIKKINNYINPMDVIYRLNITETEGYILMSFLEYLSIVKKSFKILCPNCSKVSSKIFENLNDIDLFGCETCWTDYSNLSNKYIIIIYKVIVE